MKRLGKWLLCHVLRWHDWTCNANEGIPPDRKRMEEDPIDYFFEYAQGWCKRCGRLLKTYSVDVRDGRPREIVFPNPRAEE